MNYGELPTTGLYIVLSVVVVWSAILTTQIAEVRKRSYRKWKKASSAGAGPVRRGLAVDVRGAVIGSWASGRIAKTNLGSVGGWLATCTDGWRRATPARHRRRVGRRRAGVPPPQRGQVDGVLRERLGQAPSPPPLWPTAALADTSKPATRRAHRR